MYFQALICYHRAMNAQTSPSSENALPTDINMVGGTMPWLMFFAGFMQGLFNVKSPVALEKISSISGTSAGAFIAAMTAVWHHQALLDIILNAFWDDTGKDIPWLWRVGILGNKTIQGNFKNILDEHITAEKLQEEGTPIVRTLHMEMKKWPLFSASEKVTNYTKGKEVIWLIQSLIKDQFFKLGDKFSNNGAGYYLKSHDDIEHYGKHTVFDSSKITDDVKDGVAGLIAASGQYSPILDPKTGKMRIDGEFGSWHESSETIIQLNEDISDESNLLVLTRFPRWSEEHNAVVTQSAKIMTKETTVIAPEVELLWGITDTSPEYMKHNFAVGQQAAKTYLQAIAA